MQNKYIKKKELKVWFEQNVSVKPKQNGLFFKLVKCNSGNFEMKQHFQMKYQHVLLLKYQNETLTFFKGYPPPFFSPPKILNELTQL